MIGYYEWRKEKDFWQRSETFAADMRQRKREELAAKKREQERPATQPERDGRGNG